MRAKDIEGLKRELEELFEKHNVKLGYLELDDHSDGTINVYDEAGNYYDIFGVRNIYSNLKLFVKD